MDVIATGDTALAEVAAEQQRDEMEAACMEPCEPFEWCPQPTTQTTSTTPQSLGLITTKTPTRAPSRFCPTGEIGTCNWFGDPHFLTFDGVRVDELKTGTFWIVRHESIKVQGLFCGAYVPGSRCSGGVASTNRAIAISGSSLSGHVLLVESVEGHVYWDGMVVDKQDGAEDFTFAFSEGSLIIKLSQSSKKLEIRLPGGDFMKIDRNAGRSGGVYMNVPGFHMRARLGQDGLCGNFDGDQSNDKIQPFSYKVALDEDLFRMTTTSARRLDTATDEAITWPRCPAEKIKESFNLCQQKMPSDSPQASIESCAFDVCATGDLAMADASAVFQKTQDQGPCKEAVRCRVTVDDQVNTFVYNGKDMMKLLSRHSVKDFSLTPVPGAKLVIGVENWQNDGCKQAAGFILDCEDLVFPEMEAFGSNTAFPAGDPHLSGDGEGWSKQWAEKLQIPRGQWNWPGVPKPLWPASCPKYAAFRVVLVP